jgi:hypothetical protein
MKCGDMPSVIAFAFRGTVADIDGTVPGESLHPAAVLVLEVADTLNRIVLPQWLAQAQALCVGAAVEVSGELEEPDPLPAVSDSYMAPTQGAASKKPGGSPG